MNNCILATISNKEIPLVCLHHKNNTQNASFLLDIFGQGAQDVKNPQLTVFYFTLWVRPTKGQKFAGDDPVEVSILYTLMIKAIEREECKGLWLYK